MNINHSGILYIVATPIGNLKDITQRAIETLQNVNCIAAEDTRHSQHLLQYLGISVPLIPLHEHNEVQRVPKLIDRLQRGESIALVSDAGTPLISDPGYILVRQVRKAGFQVVSVPGPCAAIAALSVAGLPTDRFVFEGFLPAKPALRKERLALLRFEPRTIIFYEAPHRLRDSLQSMQEILGHGRQMVLARELTKLFETVKSGTIEEIIAWVAQDNNQQRGEIVLLVEGVKVASTLDSVISHDKILTYLLEVLPLAQATEMTAKITGRRRNDLYQRALQLKSKSS